MPIFQQRYSESVIEQLFYHKPQNWNRKMTLNEFRNSNFLENLLYLQIDDDINIYDRYSLNTLIIERIIKGYGKKTLLNELNFNHMSNDITYAEYSNTIRKNVISDKTLKNSNIYQYQSIFHFRDFIWFMLARENKDSPEAIEYWFRCIDLDDDGYISIYEIEKFYIEQCKHMVLLHISDYWSFPDYLCYLLDMIKPKIPNKISLSDLKRSQNSTTFFNMLFDIRQYENLMKKADYFGYFEEIWIRDNWEKYAEKMYDYLANEEVQNEQRNSQSRLNSKGDKKVSIEDVDAIESADLLEMNNDEKDENIINDNISFNDEEDD
ncbi:hypothetical protein PIROE2DRAFT_19297 [Piromyces sp. E2]|nr:hypothetical protein PIROE2DRAFT_19297 [Piromyces sp. E2]|eukprot:OUM56200.1 hypothetical protein PIROE2DRAFT_19297 [Piromyces sp. E2]